MSETSDLAKRLDLLATQARQRAESSSSGTPTVASPKIRRTEEKIVQLPIWRDDRRGMPNDLVRSALFTIGNSRQKRVFRKDTVIAALGEVEITYTGEELRQDDEDVFLQLVHLARLAPLGETVEFTAHAMLKALRWSTDSRAYQRLRDSINRLAATGLSVSNDENGYNGSLVRDFEWKQTNGASSRAWKVRLEPRIVALFGHVTYTQIDWEQRLKLGNLAKWLHSFYYTHANPYALKVRTIHALSGSTTRDLSKFRQILRAALDELANVGFLENWRIERRTDLVHVTRVTSKPALR